MIALVRSFAKTLSEPVVVRESSTWVGPGGRLTGKSIAVYSPCASYRYILARQWSALEPRVMVFVGLNPSTATENIDDPTIRRLVGFAERWGLGGLTMLNYYAFRSTDPRGLPKSEEEASGPLNDEVLDFMLERVKADGHVLAFGWGQSVETKRTGRKDRRFRGVRLRIKCEQMGVVPKCFGVTERGYPKHPLYLRSASELVDFPW